MWLDIIISVCLLLKLMAAGSSIVINYCVCLSNCLTSRIHKRCPLLWLVGSANRHRRWPAVTSVYSCRWTFVRLFTELHSWSAFCSIYLNVLILLFNRRRKVIRDLKYFRINIFHNDLMCALHRSIGTAEPCNRIARYSVQNTAPSNTAPLDNAPPDKTPPDTASIQHRRIQRRQIQRRRYSAADTAPLDTTPHDMTSFDTALPDTAPPDSAARYGVDWYNVASHYSAPPDKIDSLLVKAYIFLSYHSLKLWSRSCEDLQ